jgi:2-oxo-4-hydroxy-4-carboxy-5-ureidoimidazoline decarboxylase
LASIDELEARLYGCLASRRWAHQVATGLLEVADQAMDSLTDQEWLEAMQAHSRIGERGGDSPAGSEQEQSRARLASPATLAELAAENRRYEERFGHVFLISATGRSGEEILGELRRRLRNDAPAELAEAKGELRKIARLRLAKLVSA